MHFYMVVKLFILREEQNTFLLLFLNGIFIISGLSGVENRCSSTITGGPINIISLYRKE